MAALDLLQLDHITRQWRIEAEFQKRMSSNSKQSPEWAHRMAVQTVYGRD